MYIYNADKKLVGNQTIAAEVIGLTRPTLSYILSRKVACRKVVAFCIAKYIDINANIEDYFTKVGE